MSLLGAGYVGVYIASSNLRGNYVVHQDMEIPHYDSLFDVMKDLLNGLWDEGLCLLQGTCEFVVEDTTSLVMENLEISILGLASGRHSKGSKMICNYPLTREI